MFHTVTGKTSDNDVVSAVCSSSDTDPTLFEYSLMFKLGHYLGLWCSSRIHDVRMHATKLLLLLLFSTYKQCPYGTHKCIPRAE